MQRLVYLKGMQHSLVKNEEFAIKFDSYKKSCIMLGNLLQKICMKWLCNSPWCEIQTISLLFSNKP